MAMLPPVLSELYRVRAPGTLRAGRKSPAIATREISRGERALGWFASNPGGAPPACPHVLLWPHRVALHVEKEHQIHD